eukprot:scaffold110_cov315-Pavlova_lutheri.AAC.52
MEKVGRETRIGKVLFRQQRTRARRSPGREDVETSTPLSTTVSFTRHLPFSFFLANGTSSFVHDNK